MVNIGSGKWIVAWRLQLQAITKTKDDLPPVWPNDILRAFLQGIPWP